MKTSVRWQGDMCFKGTTESGHEVVMDGPPDSGGKNLGCRPMEMLLLGLGGCTSVDLVHILKKSRQEVTDCVAEISAERATEDPKVFTRIRVHFVVTGRALDPKRVAYAIDLSATKYCSASIMLGKTAVVTHDFEIREAA